MYLLRTELGKYINLSFFRRRSFAHNYYSNATKFHAVFLRTLGLTFPHLVQPHTT